MHRKQYKSGERTFIVDQTSEKDGYYNVIDKDSQAKFRLPVFLIETKESIFSWDRYNEELDKSKVKISLENELSRLESMRESNNIKLGIKYTKKFLKDL